ncbi:MAG: sulfurtransferase TusA family protein [Candidatus Binatia bacterium]|nr:sulfurtransferase TusA family protein [Candidatus Binatia bacterium]
MSQAAPNDPRETEEMALRGVRCPLNWARAKVRLEEMPVGAHLALIVDDPRAVRDIPRAAEAHGYVVLDVTKLPDTWRIEIER